MPASKAHIKATSKWEAKAYDKILLRMRKDGTITRDRIAAAADDAGESLNSYIIEAISRRMANDGKL